MCKLWSNSGGIFSPSLDKVCVSISLVEFVSDSLRPFWLSLTCVPGVTLLSYGRCCESLSLILDGKAPRLTDYFYRSSIEISLR